jgi:hypothetical protein
MTSRIYSAKIVTGLYSYSNFPQDTSQLYSQVIERLLLELGSEARI